MDSEVKLHRSLPPLVEGKVHGYLKLCIDEIVWSKRSFGEVTVFASWWGEHDSAQFRPVGIATDEKQSDVETTETYVITTNRRLFEEYLRNCESVQLVIVNKDTHEVVGTSQITDLLDIFGSEPYFRYLPIFNNYGTRVGEIHVSIKLLSVSKSLNMQLKTNKVQNYLGEDKNLFSDANVKTKYNREKNIKCNKYKDNNGYHSVRVIEPDIKDTYKSVLKAKRAELCDPVHRLNMEVTDKLVAQVVARAQRLRGAILKETFDEDSLALSEFSSDESFRIEKSTVKEAKLYEYILGNEMSTSDERKALSTLRSTSPTPSLIELASEAITAPKQNNLYTMPSQTSIVKTNHTFKDTLPKEHVYNQPKEISPLEHVDSIRIYVDSFSLTPAGYRRVKSSCLSRNEGIPMSVTYFVQYDTLFSHGKQANRKFLKDTKPVRMCSKKQIDQVIHFNHEGTYSISKNSLNAHVSLQFKIFIRHLNQKSPTVLGIACMDISDVARTQNLSLTQRLAVISKSIKIGELKVITELGCDFIHFGKQYIDAIMSTKENIPVTDAGFSSGSESEKYRSVTGTQSKTSSKVSSASTKRLECLASNNNTDLIGAKDTARHNERNLDDKKTAIKDTEITTKNKILLHGLIHIAEGKDLPELNTYLICRAFWKEDKATSQLCTNTKNPFYHFCQLVPLIHGPDLLERIKDNYIIIEVYSKNSNNVDNLLGIVKLSVHQLYVAYRDPSVLPHLLQSRYPVISVDGWVPICNPVTGQLCGHLLALVALGTAEQIAFLEMSRGLRNTVAIPPMLCNYSNNSSNYAICSQNVQQTGVCENSDLTQRALASQSTDSTNRTPNVLQRDLNSENYKNQEIQTDISAIQEQKLNNVLGGSARKELPNSEHLVLHALVDRLAHVLSVTKSNATQTADTETNMVEKGGSSTDDQLCLNPLNSSLSECSDGSPGTNFPLPTELYRSVGVGAEYDEATDLAPTISYSNGAFDPPTDRQSDDKEETNSSSEDSFFRAVVEIDCALHLPKVLQDNEAIEPSTYVTFQRNQTGPKNQLHSYMVTNVFPHSCNPKWDWKCDTRFPVELLHNDEKRLILKIWRLADPYSSVEIDLERDVVIGFSAIDLSVLTAGFPTVSGWFHIMDFTGKCNGQIKISITPLDNIQPFIKPTSTTNVVQTQTVDLSESNWSPSHSQQTQISNTEYNNVPDIYFPNAHLNQNTCTQEYHFDNPVMDIGNNLDDVSMSFLSLSLKQKLTELDEITKRLQTRLHNVTHTAFEDDFETEFDLNELNSDAENNGNKHDAPSSADTAHCDNDAWTVPSQPKEAYCKSGTRSSKQTSSSINDTGNQITESLVSENGFASYDPVDTGYSTGSNFQSSQNLTNSDYRVQSQNGYSYRNNNLSDQSHDYPIRGTRTHINHLLDKLSLQFPTIPLQPERGPVKRNIMGLLNNIQQNSNLQDRSKYACEASLNTIPGQVGSNSSQSVQSSHSSATSQQQEAISEHKTEFGTQTKPQVCSRISSVIREELIAEESNESAKCDDLTTYLITSNIRHMDLDNIFNPLLYQHLTPDVQVSNIISPEGEAIEQLDNRYAKTFDTALNNRLCRIDNLVDTCESPVDTNHFQNGNKESVLKSVEEPQPFRLTPAGVSEHVDGKIDLRVSHKSSNNDLLASNNTESTTTISLDKSSERQTDTEMNENSFCASSESSVSAVSRQAPDGGNPVEDTMKPLITKNQDDSHDSSLSS